MESVIAKQLLLHLEKQSFPTHVYPYLRELVMLCGTKDIMYLCTICYLFGQLSAKEDTGVCYPL